MAYLRTTPGCPWYVYWVASDYTTREEQIISIDCKEFSYNEVKNSFDVDFIMYVYMCSEKHAIMLRKALDAFITDVDKRYPN